MKNKISFFNLKFKKSKNKKIFFQSKFVWALIIVIGIGLIIYFLNLYFFSLLKTERESIRQELERAMQNERRFTQSRINNPIASPQEEIENISDREPTPIETMSRVKKLGIPRFFLSRMQDTNIIVHQCLFDQGRPIYPLYIYATWSTLLYPDTPPANIALVRYLILPEDNANFKPNPDCFIKEIKTEADWRAVGERYNFYKIQF